MMVKGLIFLIEQNIFLYLECLSCLINKASLFQASYGRLEMFTMPLHSNEKLQ